MNAEVFLTMRNNFVGLSNLLGEANHFLDSFALPSRVTYLVNLALEEILTNIVKYGFDDDNEHEISVALRVKPTEVWMECSDEGRAFDPLTAGPPEFKDSISECKEGGLGIHLVRNMVDCVDYRRDKSRNIVTMRVRMSPE